MVGDMGSWDEGCWRWRRDIFDRKINNFNALISLINRVPLKQGVQDNWRWTGALRGHYGTIEAYNILTDSCGNEPIDLNKERGFKLIWNRFAPSKVITHS
ncbi:hypothetical protein ACS0TY_028884 [Phlomoides rotata]